jgi:hypothetical protein
MSGRTTRVTAAALSATLAVLAACGGGDDDGGAEEAVEVIPFAPDPVGDPATGVEMAGDDVPDCTQDDLVLSVLSPNPASPGPSGRDGRSAADVRNLAIEVAPGAACGLAGTPTVQLFPAEASAGPLQAEPAAPAEGRLLLSGRQRLVSPLIWPSSCAPEGAEVRALVAVAGTTLNVVLPDPPPCDPARPSRAGAWVPLRGRAQVPLPLSVSLVDPPTELPYGGTAEVVVEVRNDGVGPFQLDPCPQYRISFGEAEASATASHRFNCAAAPPELAPGQSLRFAAELALPPDEIPHEAEGTLGVVVTDDYGAAAVARPVTAATD